MYTDILFLFQLWLRVVGPAVFKPRWAKCNKSNSVGVYPVLSDCNLLYICVKAFIYICDKEQKCLPKVTVDIFCNGTKEQIRFSHLRL